jgi:hypothetical protein
VRIAAALADAKLAWEIPDGDADAYRRSGPIIVNMPSVMATPKPPVRRIEAKSLPQIPNGH